MPKEGAGLATGAAGEKTKDPGKGAEPRPQLGLRDGQGLLLLSPKGRQFFEVENMDRLRGGQSPQLLLLLSEGRLRRCLRQLPKSGQGTQARAWPAWGAGACN